MTNTHTEAIKRAERRMAGVAERLEELAQLHRPENPRLWEQLSRIEGEARAAGLDLLNETGLLDD